MGTSRRGSDTLERDSPFGVGDMLATLFTSRIVGVALFDTRLRYRAVNEALAAMNGLPAQAHAGQRVRYALGAVARKVEEVADRVLKTGGSVGDFDLIARLPRREETGRWIESYFPLRDKRDQLTGVAAVIVEVTEGTSLRQSLTRVTGELQGLQVELRQIARSPSTGAMRQGERGAVLARAINSLGLCARSVRSVKEALASPPVVDIPKLSPAGPAPPLPGKQRKSNRTLSSREREVLQLVVDGKNSARIARELGISVRTAETHRANIMLKMEAHSVAALVRLAVKGGLVVV